MTSAAKMRCSKTSGSAKVTQKPLGPSGQTSGSLLKKRKTERPRKSSGQFRAQEIFPACARSASKPTDRTMIPAQWWLYSDQAFSAGVFGRVPDWPGTKDSVESEPTSKAIF